VLAQALFPLLADDEDTAITEAQAAVDGFRPAYAQAWEAGILAKLGLAVAESDRTDGDMAADMDLARDLLVVMAEGAADFTLSFRRLSGLARLPDEAADRFFLDLFTDRNAASAWLARWRGRLSTDPRPDGERHAAMQAVNPVYIPRNHRVEEALAAATEGLMTPFETLLDVLSAPFEAREKYLEFENPPKPEEVVQQTFCGT
ncbi:MAG: YdiU family protein, partial [Hyphomicrobiaceae bacterium]|nr:YdiU family protein [Hyphomicrobiaceae bacterium]